VQYKIKPSKLFLKQSEKLSEKTKAILKRKIVLASKDPKRNRALKGFSNNTFRIRFKDNNNEKRAIYYVEKDKLYLLTILDRKKDYKNLTDKN
jgi:mRNA-degrading endonuclease RelE of RelBE toxin-antitoxin system